MSSLRGILISRYREWTAVDFLIKRLFLLYFLILFRFTEYYESAASALGETFTQNLTDPTSKEYKALEEKFCKAVSFGCKKQSQL